MFFYKLLLPLVVWALFLETLLNRRCHWIFNIRRHVHCDHYYKHIFIYYVLKRDIFIPEECSKFELNKWIKSCITPFSIFDLAPKYISNQSFQIWLYFQHRELQKSPKFVFMLDLIRVKFFDQYLQLFSQSGYLFASPRNTCILLD